MLWNLLKNYVWFAIGIITIGFAVYLEYAVDPFLPHDQMAISIIIGHMDDNWIPVGMAVMGGYPIFVALWDVKYFFARQIMEFELLALWVFIAISYAWHDIAWRHTLSAIAVFALFIILLIFLASIQGATMMNLQEKQNRKLIKRNEHAIDRIKKLRK